ncbi:MAG: TIGR00270 family protein [Methanobacteriota archaeon]|nr:MAG: TIGR00270 family protein [Euryarchaeota archaeon]
MVCEMCGKNVTFCKKVMIEGVLLEVCTECAKFGTEVDKKHMGETGPKPVIEQRLEQRERRFKPKDVYSEEGAEELVEDYPSRVRNARARKGITQKELAMKLNEKQTIISKVESGSMRPDEKLIKKLQKELGIALKERVEGEVTAQSTSSTQSALTLADLIRVKKD